MTSPPPPDPPDPEREGMNPLQTGLAALRAGDLDRALGGFVAAEAAAARAGDAEARSAALRHQSFVWRQRADWMRALDCAERAIAEAEGAGLRDATAEALNAKATVFQAQGDFARAEPILRQAAEVSFDRRVQALAYANLGAIAAERGDLTHARQHFLAAAERFRQAGYYFGEAVTLNNFGRAALDVGNARLGLPMLQDAREAARRAADAELLGIVLTNLAEAHERLGQAAEGEREGGEALVIFTRLANHVRRAECLRVLGALAAWRGDRPLARTRYESALEAADAAGTIPERTRIEQEIEKLERRA
jgi:tetratricopeptide (TPR) repeat protein